MEAFMWLLVLCPKTLEYRCKQEVEQVETALLDRVKLLQTIRNIVSKLVYKHYRKHSLIRWGGNMTSLRLTTTIGINLKHNWWKMTKRLWKNWKQKTKCFNIFVKLLKKFLIILKIMLKSKHWNKHGLCSLKKSKNSNVQTKKCYKAQNNWRINLLKIVKDITTPVMEYGED